MIDSDVLVIGAGASGMVAAVSAAETGESVTLLERYNRPGRKLLATGNGRCNLMNTGTPIYFGDSEFANSVLKYCNIYEQTAFWDRYGLKLREETEGRVYPFPMKSSSVLDTLLYAIKRNGVQLYTNNSVMKVREDREGFLAFTEKNIFKCRRMIVATGGPAQPKLGGNRDGYRILTEFGHTLTDPFPALTPLKTDKRSVSGLSGIRVKSEIRLITNDQIIHREKGELLFTDSGISGICVMQCSRLAIPGISELSVDFTDGALGSFPKLCDLLSERKQRFSLDSPEKLLEGILLPKIAYAVCKQAGLALRGEKAGEIKNNQIENIVRAMTDYRIKIESHGDFDSAQISAGGIRCDEFRNDTLESKLRKGIYATGEVLDADGACGGFNLMFAFACGILAGRNRRMDL